MYDLYLYRITSQFSSHLKDKMSDKKAEKPL